MASNSNQQRRCQTPDSVSCWAQDWAALFWEGRKSMFSRANNGLALLMLLLCVKKGCRLLLAITRQRLREALGLQVFKSCS